MTLASNALTSVASLEAYMGRTFPDTDVLSVYHDESSSATACTVQVLSTNVLRLIITGGANAGTYSYTLTDAANDTITELVAVLNAANKGFVARVVGTGGATSSNLVTLSATDCFGVGAIQYLRGRDLYAAEQAINSASAQIERWCGRSLKSATYRHLYDGTDTMTFRTRDFPVTAISRIAVGRRTAITATNSSTDAKEATVANDLTNLTFRIIGGAGNGSQNVAIGSNTVTQLVALINALGNNWSATANSGTAGNWPGTELFKMFPTRALNADCYLEAPEDTESSYAVDEESGVITRGGQGTSPRFRTSPWLYDWNFSQTNDPTIRPGYRDWGPIWPKGKHNIFVAFTAGYTTIPYDLEQLCNELAANLLRAGPRDQNLSSESVLGYSFTARDDGPLNATLRERLFAFRGMKPEPSFVEA